MCVRGECEGLVIHSLLLQILRCPLPPRSTMSCILSIECPPGISSIVVLHNAPTVCSLTVHSCDYVHTCSNFVLDQIYVLYLTLRMNASYTVTVDVTVLGNLPYLIFLDLSHNKLTRILDFQPPRNILVHMLQ